MGATSMREKLTQTRTHQSFTRFPSCSFVFPKRVLHAIARVFVTFVSTRFQVSVERYATTH